MERFKAWWAFYWQEPFKRCWMPLEYEKVAEASYQQGRIEVLSQISQEALIKYLNNVRR